MVDVLGLQRPRPLLEQKLVEQKRRQGRRVARCIAVAIRGNGLFLLLTCAIQKREALGSDWARFEPNLDRQLTDRNLAQVFTGRVDPIRAGQQNVRKMGLHCRWFNRRFESGRKRSHRVEPVRGQP